MTKKIPAIYETILVIGTVLMLLSLFCAKSEVSSQIREAAELPVTEKRIDPDTREFSFILESDDGRNTCIAFFSLHENIWVYEDGELIYSVGEGSTVFGRTPGGGWNIFEIRPGGRELIIRVEAVYPQVREYAITFYQGNGSQMYLELMRGSMLEVLVSILDFVIGIILIAYYLTASRQLTMGRGLFCFGLFSVMMGIWSFNETEMMTVLMENRTAASYIGYMLIMLMIPPFISFVREFLEMGQEKVSSAIIGVSMVNTVVCTGLHMTGVMEFKQLAGITHLLMLSALLYLLYALMQRMQKIGMDRATKTNLLGLMILTAAFLVDIVAYYAGARKTDVFGRFGFLLYIILLGREVAADTVRKVKAGQKAEIYRELAVKDILTGLYNRNAYDEWMKKNHRVYGAAIVMFDLNELKQCNDCFGHTAGDSYIQKAAELLTQVFEPAGSCYRIGGDEFCAIIPSASPNWIDRRIRKLEYLEREYNRSSKSAHMQIACGYAIFDERLDGDMEDTRNRADADMYQNKKKQKNGAVIR